MHPNNIFIYLFSGFVRSKMFDRNNSRAEYLAVFIILSLTSCCFCATRSNLLESPCPGIFQYRYDENGMLYGILQIDSPNDNKVQLNLELSIGNSVDEYNGNIELAHSKEKVIDDIMHRRPIMYKVYFPLWDGIPPKITKILVNGDLICSGPKIAISLVSVLTTINLQHTLRIDVQPLISGGGGSGGIFVKPSSPDINNIRPDEEDSNDSRFTDKPNRPPANHNFGDNPFLFNPTPPKKGVASVVNIDFKPQPPKDPSSIFAGNPFLNSLSSTSKPGDLSENVPGRPARPNLLTSTTTPKPAPPVTKVTTPPSPVEGIDIISKDRASDRPYDDVCGRTVATNALVINGDSVPRGAYPWLVAMFGIKATGLTYMCSGSLISNKHIVTAAHCVKTDSKKFRPQELLIILGKLNIQKWVPTNGEKMIEPESIHVHPDYETMSSDADVAVLVLSESVQFTKYIRPLCLWMGATNLNVVEGKQGTVVGWGKDENGDLMTAEPRQTNLPIVSQEQCLRSSYQFQYITSNRTFCAGFRNGSGPCNGDSGSGFLMKAKDGRWMLRGIVSMSISEAHTRTCDLKNYVVFTDASKHINWLLSFIK